MAKVGSEERCWFIIVVLCTTSECGLVLVCEGVELASVGNTPVVVCYSVHSSSAPVAAICSSESSTDMIPSPKGAIS